MGLLDELMGEVAGASAGSPGAQGAVQVPPGAQAAVTQAVLAGWSVGWGEHLCEGCQQ